MGGVPGNRTTLIVVPIVAAVGVHHAEDLVAGHHLSRRNADTMEVLARVDLDQGEMRRVVEQGRLHRWGGAVAPQSRRRRAHPGGASADVGPPDGQMVASMLSKKAAAGATHLLLDMPVGPTTKVRTRPGAAGLDAPARYVAAGVGLHELPVIPTAPQPIGRGLGPALKARDILAVLRGDPDAPQDLKENGLYLAGRVLELVRGPRGSGEGARASVLADGLAWRKLPAICARPGRLPIRRWPRRVGAVAPRGPAAWPHRQPVAGLAWRSWPARPPIRPRGSSFTWPTRRYGGGRASDLYRPRASVGELDFAVAYATAQDSVVRVGQSAGGPGVRGGRRPARRLADALRRELHGATGAVEVHGSRTGRYDCA